MKALTKTTLYRKVDADTFSIQIFYNPMAKFLPLFEGTNRKLYESIAVDGQVEATKLFEYYRQLAFSLRIDRMTISTSKGKKYFTALFTHNNF